MNKKAALELSISTIIIIVLGVTLLSLGLIFLRGTFTEITDIKDIVFERAGRELDQIGRTGKVSVPDIVDMEQGELVSFKIFVTHDGSIGSREAQFRLELKPNNNGEFERFVKAAIVSAPVITLTEGQQGEFLVKVAATGNAPLSIDASYKVLITCDGCSAPYYSSGFVVSVNEKRGFF